MPPPMKPVVGTPAQLRVIAKVGRASAAASLLGLVFILVTFAVWPGFHKPINRLIVYASAGNLIAVIAMLISTRGDCARAEHAAVPGTGFYHSDVRVVTRSRLV